MAARLWLASFILCVGVVCVYVVMVGYQVWLVCVMWWLALEGRQKEERTQEVCVTCVPLLVRVSVGARVCVKGQPMSM